MAALIYVDRSEIRYGRADELEAAAGTLARHVASSEQRALSYGIYFSADRSTMTVVHVHPDSESLEQLLAHILPVLAPFRELLDLRAIDVYGLPSDAVLTRLRAKVELLGGTITIHGRVAGVDAAVLANPGSSRVEP